MPTKKGEQKRSHPSRHPVGQGNFRTSNVKSWIACLNKGPRAFGYKTNLWTLERIAAVISKKFRVCYHASQVWRILRQMGYSCQKPERRARERAEQAVATWRKKDWPRIKKVRKRGRTTVLPDDSGFVDKLTFVFGNYIDEILFANNDSLDYYYVHDYLYSPVAFMMFNGMIGRRYEYDAYGQPTLYSRTYLQTYDYPLISYLFTGREVDMLDTDGSLKIQYNRNRYYSYTTGRWLSRDPIGYGDGRNLYEYVKSRPIMALDPMGLECICLPTYTPSPVPSIPIPGPGIIQPIECSYHAIKNALEMIKRAWEARYGLPYITPIFDAGNPFRHCAWSCRMTRAYGPIFALELGKRKEAIDCAVADLRDGLQEDGCWDHLPESLRIQIECWACSCDQFSDRFDGFVGILCGLKISIWNRDRCIWDDRTCEGCCKSMGIHPKETKEGPGTPRGYGKRCQKPKLCKEE